VYGTYFCVTSPHVQKHTSFYLTKKYIIATKYFHTMTISAPTTASPCPSQIPSQPKVCHNWPHCNTTHQICFIFGEITPFLQWKFCYMAAIATSRKEYGNYGHVSGFLVNVNPFISLNHWLIDGFNVFPFRLVLGGLFNRLWWWLKNLPIWSSLKLQVSSLPPTFHHFYSFFLKSSLSSCDILATT
jgi:hypothetical protein